MSESDRQADGDDSRSVPDYLFRSLVEGIGEFAIFMMDRQGCVLTWNEGAERMLGYAADEVLGTSFSRFFTEEAIRNGRPERELREAASTGRAEDVNWVVRKDGSRFWADVVITALHDAAGRLVGFAKVTRDLTERKRAEEDRARLIREQTARAAAQEAEHRIHTILNSITDAFFAVDHELRFTYVNDRARSLLQALLKRPGIELIGKTLWEVAPAIVGTRAEAEYRRVIAEKVPAHFEMVSPTWGVWFEVHAYPSASGMAVYFRDITPRKRLEEERDALIRAMDAERNWLQAVIEYSPIGIFRVEGVDGQRVVANRRGEELFGRPLPAEGGIAQYVGQIYLPNGTPRPRSDLATVRALHGQTVVSEEELLRQPMGREVRVLVSAVPIRQATKIVGAVVVYEDITRTRELERLREEWTSVVTHDLRQPIAVILGYVGLLERRFQQRLTPQEHQSLEHVLVAAQNLNKMIGDLLEASRIEARRLELQRTTLDLAALARDVVNRTATVTEGHPIRLEVRGDIPASSVDPARIEQVLSNLLSNAAKYSFPRTDIQVSVERRDGEVEVSVTNQGPGIAPNEIGKLFSRFYRAERARAGATRGLGLGLYISKGLVEAHGGRIWVDSIPGKTTTFHFTLPIVAPGPK